MSSLSNQYSAAAEASSYRENVSQLLPVIEGRCVERLLEYLSSVSYASYKNKLVSPIQESLGFYTLLR